MEKACLKRKLAQTENKIHNQSIRGISSKKIIYIKDMPNKQCSIQDITSTHEKAKANQDP